MHVSERVRFKPFLFHFANQLLLLFQDVDSNSGTPAISPQDQGDFYRCVSSSGVECREDACDNGESQIPSDTIYSTRGDCLAVEVGLAKKNILLFSIFFNF